jgi:LacI family transcriptional regulator
MRPGQIAEVSQGPRVKLADVAARAGVHPGTASRALSPDRQSVLGQDTVQRVVQAAADLGYEPDLLARALRTQRSFNVGVLMPDPDDPSVLPLLRGIEDGLAAAGYAALIAGPADRAGALARMRARHVDGLIVPGRVYAAAPPDAWPPGLPVVVAGSPQAPARVPAAAVDHAHGARLILDHLAGLGHQHIGRITRPASGPRTGPGRGHRPGVVDLAARAATAEEGRRCARALLRRGCTAIAAATDLLAAGALAAVTEAGLRCPADVTVTGYGDTPLSAALAPPLTTVRLPYFLVGRHAAELLLAAIADRAAPAEIRYAAPELVIRGSCAPEPAVNRPLIE